MESKPGYKGRCAASWCESRGTKSSAKFFRFPPDDSRCNKWREFALRGDLDHLTSKQMHLGYRLCSEHFVESDFSDPDRTKLLSSAVPSLIYPRTLQRDPQGNSEGTSTQELLPGLQQKHRRQRRACSALWCSTNSKNSNCSFHRFPKDDRCKAWVEFIEREDLKDVPLEKLNKHLRLCPLHFKDEDFMNPAKTRLNWNAVPSVRAEPATPAERRHVNRTAASGCPTERPKSVWPMLRTFKRRGITWHIRPAPEIDYETTIPEPLELSLSAEDVFLLGETCGSEANEEVTGDGDDCSDSDSNSVCVAEGMDYSSDEQDTVPTTKSIGLQTDERDPETTTTFSSFLCHMTRDGVATEVAHKAVDSVLPATPSSPKRKSRSRYITYIVY
ncbi:uncharacterized protein LOC119389957 [Rhipicephalus sanguineus]|uniref:uncharacterized protein LOC119389957 n=1 Tax=Rhipicephalus sanguineus TaxID=34632 RepID=UPI001894BFA8|nr:uncharacterized protein LOC119389957 [Rhipicephalus sanguineus]XP_049270553.1 uncharacterized protein LOC119389957 [Rhipicephalus sanguineus]